MEPNNLPQTNNTVQFSRIMRLPWVVAVGASVSVGLGIYTLLGFFVRLSGNNMAFEPYLLAAIIAIPIILTYAERAAVTPGSGGVYNLARPVGVVWHSFATGWLLIGGYIALIALLGWGAALNLDILSAAIFGYSLNLTWLAVLVVGLVALNNLVGSGGAWKLRVFLIYAGIVFLVLVIAQSFFESQSALFSNYYFGKSSSQLLNIAPLMMTMLWGLNLIIDTRDEIHRPTMTILPALLLTVGIGVGLGVLATIGLSTYPSTVSYSLTPLTKTFVNLGFIPDHLATILYGLFGAIITTLALNRAVIGMLRLVGVMINDGFFPPRLQAIFPKVHAPVLTLTITMLLAMAWLIFTASIELVVAVTALLFLLPVIFIHLPDIFRSETAMPANRRPKLPFHPLFPALSVLGAIIMCINLSYQVWPLLLVWAILGGVFYFVYAKKHGGIVFRQEKVIGWDVKQSQVSNDYVVMVGIKNPANAQGLLSVGARLAKARDGVLLVLQVISLPDQMPVHLKRETAQKQWEFLASVIEQADLPDATIKPLVRLAPQPADGILEAVVEENVELLLMGWRNEDPESTVNIEPIIGPIVRNAKCEVAIVKGTVPQSVERPLVSAGGGPNAPVGLSLAQDLLEPDNAIISVVNLVLGDKTPEKENHSKTILQKMVDKLKNGYKIEQQILETASIKNGILKEAKNADLILLGSTKQGFFEQSFFGGLPVDIANEVTIPTIVTRSKEKNRFKWLMHIWNFVVDPLPKLSPTRRAEVYLQMHDAAQPSVDFFVLIGLASTIAVLGLLQNSAAVIIGAMLVAPLMSPILAMAMSLVHGNMRLLRVATEATTKGITLAIFVGLIVTFLSPINAITGEIAARTSPNLLDLMVALASGAAAGYAICRKEVAAALPGVAIAAALVPPLCVVGYGLGISDLEIASGALLLFTTNLIAIIFAAAMIFLALGFYPTHTERSEVMRGLQITIASLVIIFIVLAISTAVSISQIARKSRVEAVFNDEIVSQSLELESLDVTRNGPEYLITAKLINLSSKPFTLEQLTELELILFEAVGGPVKLDITTLDGFRSDLDKVETARLLREVFEAEISQHASSTLLDTFEVSENDNGYTINTRIILFDDEISREEMEQVQETLNNSVDKPVALQVTYITGQKDVFDAPTPTPTPTVD